MKLAKSLCCVILVCGLAITALSFPMPVMNTSDLAEKADLIISGEVVSVTQKTAGTINLNGAAVPARVMTAEMRVDCVVKGPQSAASIKFEFEMPDGPLGYQGVTAGSYRMVFLKRSDADYSFVSPYYPSLAAVPGVSLCISLHGGNMLDNVTGQLAAVLQSPETTAVQKQEDLHALSTLKTAVATTALRNALTAELPELRLIASADLLERNDISGIQIAEDALTKRPPAIPDYLFHNIDYAILMGVKDERAIPTLVRLMQLPEIETRRAASSALWHTHSTAATAGLASALDDQGFEVRFYGVVGLAEITGQSEWHPNMEVFHADEARYLQHWQEWARTNGHLQ